MKNGLTNVAGDVPKNVDAVSARMGGRLVAILPSSL